MKTTVRWDDDMQRFQIVEISEDETQIIGVIQIFPDGTDNKTACAAYDTWRKNNP